MLGFHEFGDPDGTPCLYTPGWPASGLLGGIYDEAARAAGIRWISIDKPGTGVSSFDPRGSLLRYAGDVACLADQLGVDRFAAVGESGGGPHTLALAGSLRERLTIAILLAGMGPVHEKRARDGMQPVNRWLVTFARRAPWLLRAQMAQLSRTLQDPAKARGWEQSLARRASAADRRAFEQIDTTWLARATRDALADGGRAAARELVMIARPWGFAISEVTAPVEVWHGTEDRNVPVAVARQVIDALPNCAAAHIFEGQGHAIGAVVRRDVMASVRRAAGSSRGTE